jgi:ribosomal protein S18 acetylase RimI-like enzyme
MKRMPATVPMPGEPAVRLRLAAPDDRERMRVWKNANRQSFFHKDEITPAQQAAWFAEYERRDDDHNYIVEETDGGSWAAVGVLACRLRDGDVDVYNVMRGARTGGGRANMGAALQLLCATVRAHYGERISCKVLSDNPATEWYLRNGFTVAAEHPGYRLLVLDERRPPA